MANKRNGTLYVGATGDFQRRIYEHREGLLPGFTKKYRCTMLVWYELHDDGGTAFGRERQIKGGARLKKLSLIETMNPDWLDLYDDLI